MTSGWFKKLDGDYVEIVFPYDEQYVSHVFNFLELDALKQNISDVQTRSSVSILYIRNGTTQNHGYLKQNGDGKFVFEFPFSGQILKNVFSLNQLNSFISKIDWIKQQTPDSILEIVSEPDSASVNAERDRRISLGFVFPQKPDPTAKVFQVNIPNISAAMSSATAATINGSLDGDLKWYDPGSDFTWIAMDNTTLTMDARTMIMFGQTATAFNSSFYTAARAIKNRILAGETLNITDDSLWPAAQTV